MKLLNEIHVFKSEIFLSTPLKRCQFQSLQNLHKPISPVQKWNEASEIILLKQKIHDLEDLLECKNDYILELLAMVHIFETFKIHITGS